MVVMNYITFIVLAVGGINWGLVGLFNFNIIDTIFGEQSIGSKIVYTLVCLSAIWLLISIIVSGGLISFK